MAKSKPQTYHDMITITNNYHWYLIRTQHQHEKRVEAELVKQGIKVFCPKVKELKIYNGRKRWVEKPRFGMYVFVFISCKEYCQVCNMFSVIEFVKRDGVPDIVPTQKVEALKYILSNNISHQVTFQSVKNGQKIYVKNGPCSGLTGIIHKKAGKKQVAIEFENISHFVICNLSDICPQE